MEVNTANTVSPPTSSSQETETTITCCVESGPLEEMTLRLVESLRRNGGRFASCPVWAVTPRVGPPLTKATRRRFDELGVNYLRIRPRTNYSWYHFLNKILSLAELETQVKTKYITFLDSDVLVVDEPEQLVAREFTACIHSYKQIGSTGPRDKREAFWIEACRLYGLVPDDLPWVQTHYDKKYIRLYFNSGVFSYNISTSLANKWLRNCTSALDARIGLIDSKSHFIEQATLGITLVKEGLDWQELPYSHNYDAAGWLRNNDQGGLNSARILHYHDSMMPHAWAEFSEQLLQNYPHNFNWLYERGSIKNNASKTSLLTAKILRTTRAARRERYNARLVLL